VRRRRIGLVNHRVRVANCGRRSRRTYEDEDITSSRMRSNCAMTQRTLRCTPKARRKSQSWRTWSSGGVQAQRVRTAERQVK
jgi:hypothetical protein